MVDPITYSSLASYVFISVVVIGLFREGLGHSEVTQLGRYLDVDQTPDVNVIGTFPNVGFATCVEWCRQSTFCKYVNFGRNTHLCVLLGPETTSDTATVLVKRPGYVYREITVWTPEPGTTPAITGCGPPPDEPNAETRGNMSGVGNKVQYFCSNDESLTDQITCDVWGVWTYTVLMCLTECTYRDAYINGHSCNLNIWNDANMNNGGSSLYNFKYLLKISSDGNMWQVQY